MYNTVIKGTKTIEEYKKVRDTMEKLAIKFCELHGKSIDDIAKVWFDMDNNLCIEYADGSWWHYNERGEWW